MADVDYKTIGTPEDESTEGNVLDDGSFREIVEEYLASLDRPTASPKLILGVVGQVGAGKSTVMKPLAKRLNLVRISGDDIRMMLKRRGFNFTRTIELAMRVIAHLLEEDYGVAIDSNCSAQNIPETIEGSAKKHGCRALFVHVDTPEVHILERLRSRNHNPLFKNSDEAIECFEFRRKHFKNLTMPFIYTFDTSRDDVAEQIDEAAKRIKDTIKNS